MRSVFLADVAWVNGCELRRDAAVVVADGRVLDIVPHGEIGASFGGPRHRARVLLPGLINAHSHLEYSFLRGSLPRGRVAFPEWIEAIGAAKREASSEGILDAARDGIREILAGGATTVIDCAHRDEAPRALADSPIRHAVLWEVLGLVDERAPSIAAEAEARLGDSRPSPRRVAIGLNPHAPYTVSAALREWLRTFLAAHPAVACAWHLAEMPEEMEFLASRSGALADFFRRMHIPFPTPDPPGCSPVEFLRRENLLGRCDIAFHLNFPSPGEAAHFGATRAVVHCPGTHAFFTREPFPIDRVVAEGANLCLGTDSLASCDSLSMLEMVRLAAESFPMLTGRELLDMVTLNPARLEMLRGVGAPLGIIAPGGAADFAVLDTGDGSMPELRDLLASARTRVQSVWIAGEKVA